MCDTPKRPVTNATLLPTGHWGMVAFQSNVEHVKHIKHGKPCLGALMCHLGTNNRLLIYGIMCDTPKRPVRNATLLPTSHWGMVAFDSNMGHVKHIKHWKPCPGALMCYTGTNNRPLIYALCVILQPAGEERHINPNRPLRNNSCMGW